MFETAEELAALQRLLDESFANSGEHLLSIMEPQRHLSAERLSAELPSPAVLNVATVTATGEPRVSAVDGHFLHGAWYFTTAKHAVKAQHLRQRPPLSAAYTPRDGYGVFCHGRAELIDDADAGWLRDHLGETYGTEPDAWAGYTTVRIDAHWLTGFAMTDEEMEQVETASAARQARRKNA